MAAKSSNGSGCAASGAGVADRLTAGRLDGRPHRCRRPRRRPGCLVRLGQVRRGSTGASLDQGHQSLPADCDRSASRSLRRQRVRPATRGGFANLHLRAATVEAAPTTLGTTVLDRAAAVRARTRAQSAIGAGWIARLRRLYTTHHGTFDCTKSVRGDAGNRSEQGPNAVPSRFVSATPGPADGRSGRRGGSLPLDVGRLHSLVRGSRTRIDGTNGARLRSHTGRNRIRLAAVFNAQLSLGS